MKGTTNRYRPPRVQYRLDDWNKRKITEAVRKKKDNRSVRLQNPPKRDF
jgi:hypothetical protein